MVPTCSAVEDADDVGVVEGAAEVGLTQEAVAEPRVVEEAGERPLEGESLAAPLGLVDDGHAALPEPADEGVLAERHREHLGRPGVAAACSSELTSTGGSRAHATVATHLSSTARPRRARSARRRRPPSGRGARQTGPGRRALGALWRPVASARWSGRPFAASRATAAEGALPRVARRGRAGSGRRLARGRGRGRGRWRSREQRGRGARGRWPWRRRRRNRRRGGGGGGCGAEPVRSLRPGPAPRRAPRSAGESLRGRRGPAPRAPLSPPPAPFRSAPRSRAPCARPRSRRGGGRRRRAGGRGSSAARSWCRRSARSSPARAASGSPAAGATPPSVPGPREAPRRRSRRARTTPGPPAGRGRQASERQQPGERARTAGAGRGHPRDRPPGEPTSPETRTSTRLRAEAASPLYARADGPPKTEPR